MLTSGAGRRGAGFHDHLLSCTGLNLAACLRRSKSTDPAREWPGQKEKDSGSFRGTDAEALSHSMKPSASSTKESLDPFLRFFKKYFYGTALANSLFESSD